MKKIIQFVSSHRIGVTGQLVSQAEASLAVGGAAWVFVSGEKEQYPGLAERLRRAGAVHLTIPGLDDHRGGARLMRALAAVIAQHRPDYVSTHTNWQLALTAAAGAARGRRPRIVYTIHGYRHNHPVRAVAARAMIATLLRICAFRVIAPSTFVARRFGFVADRISVIPIGEGELIHQDVPEPDFQAPPRIIFAGEFRSGKNQELLVRALKSYRERSGETDARLVLPGRGERLEACRALAARLGLGDHVEFPGFLAPREVLSCYRGCQYAVVATNVETFGHCIVEPLLLGRLVLCRRVGVAEDVIRHGENGFFFDTESELVDLMCAIGARRAELPAIARRARECRPLFRWERIVQRQLQEVFT